MLLYQSGNLISMNTILTTLFINVITNKFKNRAFIN